MQQQKLWSRALVVLMGVNFCSASPFSRAWCITWCTGADEAALRRLLLVN